MYKCFIYFKIFTIYSLIINYILLQRVNTNELYPTTPSSSYGSDYFKRKNLNNNYEIKDIDFKQKEVNDNFKSKQKNIKVKGNIRLDPTVIIRDSKINDYDFLDQKAFSNIIKNLYATGYFSDVKITENKQNIFISIKENPIIDNIAFEGNKEINDETILSEISLRAKKVFSSSKVKSDILKIQNLYKRLGFFSTFIDAKIINLGQNRINLVFEINEGLEAKIKKINFIGNKEFSDSTLSDVIFSEQTRWYKFWGSSDKFDQDRIDYDKDLLKKYYYDNGYIDFRVISANSQLVMDRKNFVINFKVFEGSRYMIEEINIEITNKELNNISFNDLISSEENDWFSSKLVERDIDKITEKSSDYGYAFVDVRPKIRKNKNGKVILTYVIEESEKIFVERINIRGNSKTHDKVIRREIQFSEGDAFNLSKIKKSERNLNKLGLFNKVELNYDPLPRSNKTNIDIEIEEASTGEFSVGAGFSSLDGALANVGIKESNLFGEGRELSLALGISTRKSNIDLKYTEPFFLGKNIATGIDIFNIRNNMKTYSGYKHNMIGFKLRAGYEIIDDLRHFSSYTLRRDKIHDIDPATSIYIRSQEGKNVTSAIGQALQYDNLNDRLNPTDGYRLRFDIDYFGLGGDSNHIATELAFAKFTKLFETTFVANFIEVGYIEPLDDQVKINDRFIFTGERIRGFKNAGVGPRDVSTTDALGGEKYIISRNELNFPLGLPEDLGVGGLIFGDIGTLFKASETGTNVRDDIKFRASAGIGISWQSPFGPVKIYLSKAFLKESFDKVETFRFSFGTTY